MERLLSPRIAGGLIVALYVLSFPYHPGLRSPNELCRLWQSRALVDFGTIRLNEVVQQRGMVGDLSCTAVVVENGTQTLFPCVGPQAHPRPTAQYLFPSKAPLVSFAAAPVYWVLSRFGPVSELAQVYWSRLVVLVLPSLALVWLLWRFLRAFVKPELATVVAVLYAAGTIAYSYTEAFMSHQLTAVLLFAAFFAAWRVERGEWSERGYALAGLWAGAAVAAEYTAALGVLCVASFTLAKRMGQWSALARAAGWVVLGAALPLGALCWYHQLAFGNPLTSGYKFLFDEGYQHWHQGGFLGIKLPKLDALGLSFFSPLRGLFTLSPVLAFSLFAFPTLKKLDRAQLVFLIVVFLTHAYFTASFAYDSWGWTVGPRHLTGVIPFLMLPVALTLERWLESSRVLGSIAAGLGVASVLAIGMASFVNYVPPECSTSVFGLALPLMSEGYFPITVLAAVVPNPWSGWVVVLVVLALAVFVSLAFRRAGALMPVLLGALVLHAGVLRLFTDASRDQSALTVLKGAWLVKPGQTFTFRGP